MMQQQQKKQKAIAKTQPNNNQKNSIEHQRREELTPRCAGVDSSSEGDGDRVSAIVAGTITLRAQME